MKNLNKKMQQERGEKFRLKHLNKEKLENREMLQERVMQDKQKPLNKPGSEETEIQHGTRLQGQLKI